MTPIERDDFIHALGQTFSFYDKELDPTKVSFWITACKSIPVKALKSALLDHVQVGKFAPRPADIIKLAQNHREHISRALPPPPMETKCDPEIAKAWRWFIQFSASGGTNRQLTDAMGKKQDISPELQDKYLAIVNGEARTHNCPEAISDEYKLREVWG